MSDGQGRSAKRGIASRMNSDMSRRVERLRAEGNLRAAEPAPKLAKLATADLVETVQGIALGPLLPQAVPSGVFQDKTGFEAWVNKIHIEDFVDDSEPRADEVLLQGLLYAEQLAARLATTEGSFRIFLCVDNESNDVTCRFHSLRDGEVWFVDNPDLSTTESLAIWDVDCGASDDQS